MIIENNLDLIKKYQEAGVDRIFLDLEILGKEERQGHLNTVISFNHSIDDVTKISKVINKSELLVRVNPINESSKKEINKCIEDGADILMLPMFKTKEDVQEFLSLVGGRVKTCLLLETSEALCRIDSILELSGIDEIHIGLNDLHLSMNLDFMFELLSGGIVEYLANKIKAKGISFGFGGIATLNEGMISGEMILKEHVRLNSSMVILSRAFKKVASDDFQKFNKEFIKLKNKLKELNNVKESQLKENQKEIKRQVEKIISKS